MSAAVWLQFFDAELVTGTGFVAPRARSVEIVDVAPAPDTLYLLARDVLDDGSTVDWQRRVDI